MSPAHTPRVFTIPASVPFLPALVRALVDGELVPGFAPASDAQSLLFARINRIYGISGRAEPIGSYQDSYGFIID